VTDDRRPIRVSGVSVTGRDSEPTLVGAPQLLQLNETALAIWDLCDGATTVDEMVDAVVDLGLDAAQARADVQGVVDEFQRLGVITQAD
jgi:Coenzyme PQQ synthesis protein D (PqqD)